MRRMPSREMSRRGRRFFDARGVAQQDRHAQTQRVELPGGLEHARLGAFREDDPLGMPLQFLYDAADESHGC